MMQERYYNRLFIEPLDYCGRGLMGPYLVAPQNPAPDNVGGMVGRLVHDALELIARFILGEALKPALSRAEVVAMPRETWIRTHGRRARRDDDRRLAAARPERRERGPPGRQ